MIVCCCESGGERTHEPVEHQLDVVVEDIDFRENCFEVGVQSLQIEYIIGPLHSLGFHVGDVPFRCLLVVEVGQCLPQREGQHRYGVEGESVNIFRQEGKFPVDTVLLDVYVEFSESQHQFFVTGGFVIFGGLDTVLVLVFNHFLDQFYGGIPFSNVFLSLFGDHDLLQGLGRVDEKIPVPLVSVYDHCIRFVEGVADHQCVALEKGQMVGALCVGVGTYRCSLPLQPCHIDHGGVPIFTDGIDLSGKLLCG